MSDSTKSDFLLRLDKAWKAVGAVVGILGLLIGASSWAFTYAMTGRDQESRELRKSVERLEGRVEKLQDRLQQAERRASDDMSDIRVALIAIRTRLEFGAPLEAASQVGAPSGGVRHYRPRPAGSPRLPTVNMSQSGSSVPSPAPEDTPSHDEINDELTRSLQQFRERSPTSNPFMPRTGNEFRNLNDALDRITNRHVNGLETLGAPMTVGGAETGGM